MKLGKGWLLWLLLMIAMPLGIARAQSPGPLPIRVVEPGPKGAGKPLANVTVHAGGRHAATDAKGIATFEGLPAGPHTLSVLHPGFEVLSQPVAIPPGARPAVELTLTPARSVNWGGKVVVAGRERGLAGVSMDLKPLAVKAALTGAAHSISAWQGDFEFPDLPAGRYELRAVAPGFDPLVQEVEVGQGDLNKETAFDQPRVDGVALDLCREWGRSCGKPAADHYCREQGYLQSLEHRVQQDAPPTRVITTRAMCEQSGCDRITWVKCGGEADKPLALGMRPQSKSVRQPVKVTDQVTGKPIAGAKVGLAETWPKGLIGDGQTDSEGRLTFKGLQRGSANFVDKEGRVRIARRRITARVEAEGYESAVVPLSLGDGDGVLQVALNPLMEQPEVEPNNELEAAQTIRTGAPILFKIAERGDHDFFKFRLSEPARLMLTIGPQPALKTRMLLRDGDGQVLKNNNAYRGKDNVIEQWVGSGSFSVEVMGWGNNQSDPDTAMMLTVVAEPAVDPAEPNNRVEAATHVQLNQQLSGLLWPVRDQDFYRLEIAQPGILRVTGPAHSMQRLVRVHDQQGSELGARSVYQNQGLELKVEVQAGIYFVEVAEWGNNHASLDPYRLSVEMMPDDGVDDPPPEGGSMRAIRSLASPAWLASTLLPTGDQDIYSVSVPGAGVLRVQSKGGMQRLIQIYDGNANEVKKSSVYKDETADLSWHAPGPRTVFLSVREWGDNSYASTPYSLRVWFERADEVDFQQRNDDFDHATPLLPGDIVYGSYLPLRDVDVYAVDSDFPGYLSIRSVSEQQTHISVFDAQRREVTNRGAYAKQVAELRPQVGVGRYYIRIGEWGDNAASVSPYELKVVLERAEPAEDRSPDEELPRSLRDGEAQAFSIDHPLDRDGFVFEMAQAGKVTLSLASPVQTLVRVFDDRTGERLHESGHYLPVKWSLPLEVDGPRRLRIELSEWGNNNRSSAPGFVMMDTKGRALHADRVNASSDGAQPERVAFQRERLDYTQPATRCEVDLNGDGRAEVRLAGDKAESGRFPREGRYVVESVCTGPDGQRSRQRFWVQATGNRAREGIALFLNTPMEGQVVDQPLPLSAQAISYSGRPIAVVKFALDGNTLATDYSPPYDAELNWQRLRPGEHTLDVLAYDTAGAEAKLKRGFRLSEYFGLSPANGAVLSGESIRVSWLAEEYGETRLRYRLEGSEQWQHASGQNGRLRVVELKGLEAGVSYEIQPMGGAEPGPRHTLTRVKGLAFGKPRYGANVRRDYDQRVGISVRNNGDEPLSVRLECGKPRDPALLVGFVGEGSEDKPFSLAPGEVREFLLGISAQDVNTADHSVPVRIVSDNGLSDEAEVAIHVKLPHVELVWEDQGEVPGGHGRKLRLRNKGDTITDLSVTGQDEQALIISPTVRHGLLAGGAMLDFTVTPRFYDGFKGISTEIVARGLDKAFSHRYEMKLGKGERLRRIWLFPGMDPTDADMRHKEPELIRRAARAEQLDPTLVDWSRRENPQDLDRDGRTDRWSMNIGDLHWVGDDTDADNQVDFIHADVGDDGIFEYSAIQEGDEWHTTNLVEAWLEMGFSLPWNRASYHPHDTDIVLNGVVIGSLRDVIPEGNYSFRIPPAALRFDKNGMPSDNRVGISSKHLRGGHYVVNSDFRFKFRLTATPVWTVAKSEDEARQSVVNRSGLSIAAPDLSLSSAELRLELPAEPKAGDVIGIEIPVRNLGSVSPPDADLALFRTPPGGKREELARVAVGVVPLHGGALARIDWKATPGAGNLSLVADPDNQLNDLDTANNEAVFFVQIKGEERPLRLKINHPRTDAVLNSPRVTLEVEMNEEVGAVEPALSIDGGLWTELPPATGRVTSELLLQPGDHRLELRVRDSAGNLTSEKRAFKIATALPESRIVSPKTGTTVAQPRAHVVLAIPEGTALAGVRAAGGPWHKAVLAGKEAHADLPLRFGNQTIDALVADSRGVVRTHSVEVNCTRQPLAGEASGAAGASERGLLWPEEGSDLAIDLFQNSNGVLAGVPRETTRADVGAVAEAAEPAMGAKQKARYVKAKKLRQQGADLQAAGRLREALAKYRTSLKLYSDRRLASHILLIEGVVGGEAAVGRR